MNNIAPLPTQDATELTQESLTFDAERLAAMQRMAEVMAGAHITVPKHLQSSPGDCLAVIMQAAMWGMNPFALAQKTHVINGALGYEAQLVNAVVSSSTLLESRIDYAWEGDWSKVDGKKDASEERAVTVAAKLRGERQARTLRVSMAQVGPVRNSPLWVADPRQQLAYLATKRWARLHAPDVLLGVYTPDELAERDMGSAEVLPEEPTETERRTDSVKARLKRQRPALLEEVIAAIEQAEDHEALTKAGELAAKLRSADDKQRARNAYKARAGELAAEATPQDAEPEALELAPPTLTDSLIAAAKTTASDDDRAEIMDAARDLPEADRDRIAAAFAG